MNASASRQRFLPVATASLGPRNEVGNATEFVAPAQPARAAAGRVGGQRAGHGAPGGRSLPPRSPATPRGQTGPRGGQPGGGGSAHGQDKEV